MARFLQISRILLFTAACFLAGYTLSLWLRDPELSQMGLFLRYWYLYVGVICLVTLGGTCTVLDDMG